MAINLYIREHRHLGRTDLSDSVPVVYEDGTEIDTVVDVTAAVAHTIDKDTKWLTLCVSGTAGFSYVLSPVASAVAATAANFRVPPNTIRVVRVPDRINVKGQAPVGLYQISAITNT